MKLFLKTALFGIAIAMSVVAYAQTFEQLDAVYKNKDYIYWFMLALGLLALELASGTFYMLLLSVALAIGGVASLLGLVQPIQIMLAALTGILGTVILRRMKSTHSTDAASHSLDTGQPVQLIAWHEDGSARVRYRGAEWDAEPESADMPHEGILYIKAIHGSKLVLTLQKPQQ